MFSRQRILSFITNRFLELIILPTEQCNFRCIYCYEDFSIGKMSPTLVMAIKKLLHLRLPHLDMLKISWFGGEPLAAKNIVLDISEFIHRERQIYPQLKYHAGMTTNGFNLTPTLLDQLIKLGISDFQISLDGTKEMHDKTRKRMNGEGSFDRIWQNLIAAKASDLPFTITLRIHLTPQNLIDVAQLTELIKETFAYDGRFTVFFKTIENLGGPNQGSFQIICGQDKAQILQNFQSKLAPMIKPKQISDDPCYVCYAAQTNSLVIRANGKISKCTVAFSDERNDLGQLQADGTLRIDDRKLALWTRGLKSQNPRELSCPITKMPSLSN